MNIYEYEYRKGVCVDDRWYDLSKERACKIVINKLQDNPRNWEDFKPVIDEYLVDFPDTKDFLNENGFSRIIDDFEKKRYEVTFIYHAPVLKRVKVAAKSENDAWQKTNEKYRKVFSNMFHSSTREHKR